MKICFYNVDVAYVDFLKKYETSKRGFTRVPNIQYKSGNNKFFYGTVLNINGIDYFVPISSKQHNRQDDIPIRTKDKYKKELSTLRFAYMLPIPQKCLSYLDINQEANNTRKETLRKELAFCMRNRDKIQRQAKTTYERITNHENINLSHNSCDFKLLEKAYIIYCYENGLNLPDELKEQYLEITKNDTEQSNIEPSVSQLQQQSDSINPKEKSSEKRFTITRKKFNENVQKVSRESSEQSAALQTKSRKRSTCNPNGSGNPDNR